jgi:hypothetical protein
MEVSGQIHAPASLPPGKNSRYTLDKRVGGTHGRFGRSGEKSRPYRNSNPVRLHNMHGFQNTIN